MPIVLIHGHRCRVQSLLNAIATQEALEHQGTKRADAHLRGPRAIAGYERDRMAAARRRNLTEKRLRPDEHKAWCTWRDLDTKGRAAVYAALTARPPINLG